MTIKIIKVYFRADRNGYTQPSHTYKMGVGPCGRDVIALKHDIDRGHHHIEQFCEDGDPDYHDKYNCLNSKGQYVQPDTYIYPQDTVARVVTYTTDTPWVNQERN